MVGQRIPGWQPNREPVLCDAFGDKLLAAILKGGGQMRLHNAAQLCTLKLARSVRVQAPDDAQHVFRSAVPPAAGAAMDVHAAREAGTGRQRFGYVPDLLMHLSDDKAGVGATTHARLYEVKTLLGTAAYASTPRGMRAVDRRADAPTCLSFTTPPTGPGSRCRPSRRPSRSRKPPCRAESAGSCTAAVGRGTEHTPRATPENWRAPAK